MPAGISPAKPKGGEISYEQHNNDLQYDIIICDNLCDCVKAL